MTAPVPSFAELVAAFGRIGCINFGGPAGQIALMHRTLVVEKGWVAEDDYLHALNFCTLLPGPEAQQLATYVGWRLHGLKGGLAAGLLFVAPGAAIVLALSALYAYAADFSLVAAAFLGVKAAVVAIVIQALVRLSGRALKTRARRFIAVAAFLALAAFQTPFPVVLAVAALTGAVLANSDPGAIGLDPSPPQMAIEQGPGLAGLLRTVTVWLAVWAAPVALAAAALGPDHMLVQLGLLFSKLAVVTFGGAYAVLAYLAQQAVDAGWLTAGEMVDGLGLAETTPGPLILVTQFVGFLAAFRAPEPFAPFVAGLLGAGMTLWVTFTPSFLWIFAGAPYLERLRAIPRLQGALAAITAAVVGVIAHLSLWFAMHVIFRSFTSLEGFGMRIDIPAADSLSAAALALTAVAVGLVFLLRAGVIVTLAACAALALGFQAAGWIG